MKLNLCHKLILCLPIFVTSMVQSLISDPGGPSNGGSGAPDVRVTVSVSENFVTLSCDVTGTRAGADDHKVQFFCPVLHSDVQCYGDCSPICTMQTDGSCRVMDPLLDNSASISCQKMVSPDRESKSVRLRVDTREARLAGRWRCKFRGTSSATVSLAQHIPAPAQASPTLAPPEAAAEPVVPTPRELELSGFTERPHRTVSSSSDLYSLGVWKPDAKRYPSEFSSAYADSMLARFARTDYIIGVLTIMSVSLLLNIGFCVRFILARHYVETRRRNHRKPLGWLGSCLCVSTVQVTLDADAAHPDGAAAAANAASTSVSDPSRRRRQGDNDADGGMQQPLQRQHLLQLQRQQQPPCLYCMQTDCRILYDDVARSASECSSSCSRVAGVGCASFRCGPFEGHAGRGSSLLGVAVVPEETAAAAASDEAGENQDGSESGFAASDPSSRLELSRRMLRKADTLLREANSLLLEAEPTTDQLSEQ